MTYGGLEEDSNRLAHLLAGLGVARGDRVGIYLDKSLEAVVAIYGALKAGATYVPFDPGAPLPRLVEVARDAGIKCLLTGKEKIPTLGPLLQQAPGVVSSIALNAEEWVEDGA